MSTPKASATSAPQLAANRRNAQKSTGPRTPEGKARSCRNGLTHGMRAQVPFLPGEDAAAYDEERQAMLDDFQPETRTEVRLIDNMHRSLRSLDRCQRQEAAVLAIKIDEADTPVDRRERDELRQLIAALPDEPAATVDQLRRNEDGLAWMIARWEALAVSLDGSRRWSQVERDQAIHLLGVPLDALWEREPRAQAVTLACLALDNPEPPREWTVYSQLKQIGKAIALEVNEWQAHAARLFKLVPTRAGAVAELQRIVAEQLAALRTRAANDRDADRRAARDQARAAAAFDASPEGALRLRYMVSHQMAFSRSLRDLISLRKQLRSEREDDQSAGPDEEPPIAGPEPRTIVEPVAEPAAEPVAELPPNEPEPAAPSEPISAVTLDVQAISENPTAPAPVAPAPYLGARSGASMLAQHVGHWI